MAGRPGYRPSTGKNRNQETRVRPGCQEIGGPSGKSRFRHLPEKTAVKFADNVGAPEETGKAETVTGADQTEEQAAETAILVATRVARARRASASASNLMAETTVQDRLARARSNAEAAAGEAEYETEGPVQAVEE